jgi:hypothetical protein
MSACGMCRAVHSKEEENVLLEAVKKERQLPAVREQLTQGRAN